MASGVAYADITSAQATAVLESVRPYAVADDSFEHGWKYVLHLSLPSNETLLKLKLTDFSDGIHTVGADHMRIYSAQSNMSDAANALVLTGPDTWSAPLTLTSDLNESEAGRQVDVTVEVRVPVGTEGGSFGTTYAIQSDEPAPPPPPPSFEM